MRKPSPDPKGFNTLQREHSFRHPPKNASTLPIFQELVGPQIHSFDALFEDPKGTEEGLVHDGLKYIPEKVVFDKIGEDGADLGKAKGSRLSLRITGVSLGRPMVPEKDRESRERRIFPSESNRCNITGLSSAELVSRHEEAEEFGGYFIINGNEKLIRYLILPRRNYPMAVTRNSFQKRGPTYTRYGVTIRCVRTDQQAMSNTLHYCTNGNAMLRFYWYKNEYMVPIILLLKALIGAPDKEIFEGVMMGDYENTFMTDRVELLLRNFKSYKLYTQKQCLEFLGERFRVVLGLPEDYSNQQLGMELLDRVLLVHLDSSRDKYRLLIFMLRKLLALVSGACCDDNPDSPANHEYGMDNFPNGTNAVVAVISYTGYDMEDAMILNKSAHERGFGYGSVIKSMEVDLTKERGAARYGPPKNHFGIGRDIWKDHRGQETVDTDGLPIVGAKLEPGDMIAAYVNDTTGKTCWIKYKGDEACYVETVRALGGYENEPEMQRIQITLRIPRSPVIGDKFSSRHGQKGVCSQKWPAIDMPFSESGIQPDVIINPHAFPSRMTIGMFVESMAGKAGAMHGIPQDGSPFKFSEEDRAVDYFGKQLLAAGYNYFGNEPMYSGITGQEFHADIYLGVVYYQRLRHMVLDKFQCRTTGPGRKKGGGVRFGEMERDALLAHGTSFLLQDRLMNCSDYSTAWVCRTCGSLISLGYEDVSLGETVLGTNSVERSSGPLGEYCRVCRAEAENAPKREREALNGDASKVVPHDKGDVRIAVPPQNILGKATKGGDMDVIAIPFVFRYLCAELAAMGIKISLEVS
ncbi:hypothetical protein M407DRAFT_86274 [Tulasnella calospora MUT 4182]|uniref:DNA-directed RNA polymerase n=1 Tax=Tulasnella calospora MUT 4182 TaxID=1051891 RepID=A0A0C3Q1R9_9AGAM|nr:hypothetical protein M407DRAFT_86274 [Tulasnella calospora MUT 4182]